MRKTSALLIGSLGSEPPGLDGVSVSVSVRASVSPAEA